MLFADPVLVRRIEHAECRLTADVAEIIRARAFVAMGPQAAPNPGAQARASPGNVFVASIAGGVAVHVGMEAPFNKMIGVGLEGPLDEAALGALEAIEGEFATRRAPLQAEIAT